VKMSSSLIRNLPVCWRLLANRLSRSSESDEVFICLCAVASIDCKSEALSMRFPF
jgi:hypothetical protein